MTLTDHNHGAMADVADSVARLSRLEGNELESIDAWWRAANYLTIGQIYLRDNPLVQRPLAVADIKPRLLGHWGTSPGLSFIYAHASRLIRATGQSPPRGLRARTPRRSRISLGTGPECLSCSGSSRRRAGSRATHP